MQMRSELDTLPGTADNIVNNIESYTSQMTLNFQKGQSRDRWSQVTEEPVLVSLS